MIQGGIPRPVAIVGAGWLGGPLAQRLGGPAIACTKTGATTIPGVDALALDITDPELDPSALGRARSLVVAVAPGRDGDRRALYVDGVARLLSRVTAPLARIVFIGSTSALPDRDAWLFEDCEAWPDEERGRIQREAEAIALSYGVAHRVPTLVLRLGGLYGPGRELDRIYRSSDRAPREGHGWAPTNLVHRDDAIAAIVAALGAPDHLTGIVHVVDHDHVPRRAMLDALADRAGAPRVAWQEPIPADGVPRGKRVGNARLQAWLGVRLAVPTHH